MFNFFVVVVVNIFLLFFILIFKNSKTLVNKTIMKKVKYFQDMTCLKNVLPIRAKGLHAIKHFMMACRRKKIKEMEGYAILATNFHLSVKIWKT